MSKDLALIKQIGYTSDMLTRVSMVNERLSYTFNISGIDASIVPTKTESSVIYKITEGSICNLLEFCNNGDIILDGHLVTISRLATVTNANTSPAPRLVDNYWTETCPYGVQGDYTSYYGIDDTASVDFGQSFLSIATTTLVSLLCLHVHPLAALAISTVTGIALAMKAEHPASTAASYKDHIYVHKTNGLWVIPNRLSVEQHRLYLYSLPNFAENATHIKSYKCKAIEG